MLFTPYTPAGAPASKGGADCASEEPTNARRDGQSEEAEQGGGIKEENFNEDDLSVMSPGQEREMQARREGVQGDEDRKRGPPPSGGARRGRSPTNSTGDEDRMEEDDENEGKFCP